MRKVGKVRRKEKEEEEDDDDDEEKEEEEEKNENTSYQNPPFILTYSLLSTSRTVEEASSKV